MGQNIKSPAACDCVPMHVCARVLDPNISKTLRDRDLVTMDNQQEIAYGESIGHLIDHVTWPCKVKVATPKCLGLLSRKRLEIQTRLQWNTHRKWHMGNQIITWPMTSVKCQSWPWYVWARERLSRKATALDRLRVSFERYLVIDNNCYFGL